MMMVIMDVRLVVMALEAYLQWAVVAVQIADGYSRRPPAALLQAVADPQGSTAAAAAAEVGRVKSP
jgi:hypothetical protein